tara:strand:- start:306 stop:677 length:372 start_codon:yes stop_codon:yes gene_type:complete
MTKKETRVANLDEGKLVFVIALVFLIGIAFSDNLTGNAGRVNVATELNNNEFNLVEGTSKLYNGNNIKLNKISADQAIIIQINNGVTVESRLIQPGHKLYVNGLFVTNIGANPAANLALIRVE